MFYDDDPRSKNYPFEDDVSWRDNADPCGRCGEPLYGERAEIVENDEHLIIHGGCYKEGDAFA